MEEKKKESVLYVGRKLKGLTLQKVCEKTGISVATMIRYENFKLEEPSISNIRKLCDLYGIRFEDAMKQFIEK